MAGKKYLTTGGTDPFLPHLLDAIDHATEIDFAVAFVKATGLRLIFDALSDAVTASEESGNPRARLRIITTDYLNVTDPEALRMLMLLNERGAEVRIFEAGAESFHMKAYIFVRTAGGRQVEGQAFIGSSNISRSALTTGLEWNYRIHCTEGSAEDQHLALDTTRSEFEKLFNHEKVIPVTYDWIDGYESRHQVMPTQVLPGADEREPAPTPWSVQKEALRALIETRELHYRRGLVVMATGLGKTWLAAFDAREINAKRILFVAHREEILMQAEQTFLRINPNARVGYYTGKNKDEHVDVLCASVQTLGKERHLERFPKNHFDYVVVDEFHHAAAKTYRKVLNHFSPRFLLGLTATPDRTDQSNILSLCDDNLVFSADLFRGISSELLAPFHYYGIFDESVDYREIPWRSSKFDPTLLSNKLATLARAKHALRQWRQYSQARTLAFCVSIKHADFMTEKFNQWGVSSAAVYGGSAVSRSEGLARLLSGELAVVFSVDLFNEGVDLPTVDTVMMLRPTESKIMFLQQLGRGLRKAAGKTHLVVLDFIGNHKGFFNKPQALFNIGSTQRALAEFAQKVQDETLELPAGCFVNYDLELIDFLKQLDDGGPVKEYQSLKASLGHRPTLAEMYRAGVSLTRLRQQFGSWWRLVEAQDDLTVEEARCLENHDAFLREIETTQMTKSFKMVVLESLLENNGFVSPPTVNEIAQQAFAVFERRRPLVADIKSDLQDLETVGAAEWLRYWKGNPINAWIGGNRASDSSAWFEIKDAHFCPTFEVQPVDIDAFSAMVQELVDYRFARYLPRLPATGGAKPTNVVPLKTLKETTALPFFPNIKIACGHFRDGVADAEEYRDLGPEFGRLDASLHFIARASGNSMNGGKQPINDGDYLLLERITPGRAGSITGSTMLVERIDDTGNAQYLLRKVQKDPDGSYRLHATNPDYEDMSATGELNTFARFKTIIDPLALAVDQSLMREDIPELFGVEFNPGNWNVGHVVLEEQKAHILLVTLNKQGKAKEHKYLDHFIDEHSFHWESQNSTSPDSKRGIELINHQELGIAVHLFVRESKLGPLGKAAPFQYYGGVTYVKHKGSRPMSVIWRLNGA